MQKKESMKLKKIIKSAALANLLLTANISATENKKEVITKMTGSDLITLQSHLIDETLEVNGGCGNSGCNNISCSS